MRICFCFFLACCGKTKRHNQAFGIVVVGIQWLALLCLSANVISLPINEEVRRFSSKHNFPPMQKQHLLWTTNIPKVQIIFFLLSSLVSIKLMHLFWKYCVKILLLFYLSVGLFTSLLFIYHLVVRSRELLSILFVCREQILNFKSRVMLVPNDFSQTCWGQNV